MVAGSAVAQAIGAYGSWKDATRLLQELEDAYARTRSAADASRWVEATTEAIRWALATAARSSQQAQAHLHACLVQLAKGLSAPKLPAQAAPFVYATLLVQLLSTYPVLDGAGVVLAFCYLQHGQLDEAKVLLDGLQQASLHAYADEVCILHAALALICDGHDPQPALASLLTRIEAAPTPALSFWYVLLSIHARTPTTDLRHLLPHLEVAIAGDYQPVASCNLHAFVLAQGSGSFKAGDFREAGELLARAMQMDFDQPDAAFNYAMLLGKMGKAHEMQHMLELVLEAMVPPPPAALTITPRQTTVTRVRQHLVATSLENHEYATAKRVVEALTQARDLVEVASPFQLSQLIRDRIFVLLELDLHEDALEIADAALQRHFVELDPVVVLYKADALLCLGRIDECTWTMDRLDGLGAVESAPTLHAQVLNNHALTLACRGDVEGAVRKLHECRRLFPRCRHAAFNLTLLLWRKGDKAAACVVWLDHTAAVVDATVTRGVSVVAKPTTHVKSRSQGQVDPIQVAALDRLVRSFSNSEANVRVVQRALELGRHFADVMAAPKQGATTAVVSLATLFFALFLPQWSSTTSIVMLPSPIDPSLPFAAANATLHVGIWGACLAVTSNRPDATPFDPSAIYTCASLFGHTLVQVNCTSGRGVRKCSPTATESLPASLCSKTRHGAPLNWHQSLHATDPPVRDIRTYLDATCGSIGRVVVGTAGITLASASACTFCLLLDGLLCVCACTKRILRAAVASGYCTVLWGALLLGAWRTQVANLPNARFAFTVYAALSALCGFAITTYFIQCHATLVVPRPVKTMHTKLSRGSVYVDTRTGMHVLVEETISEPPSAYV
ncbi:hypothetical protein SPRG_01687 [Saprolegnia parasitica CBS 223.65]|uniref:Uncharacterized protein n=1 Tax=Saprolegnia parasitica (strain CBS 223.65) TaxID=695850 RepID=A0A067CTI2_SAPPC|nr:hypothetical protein SPRG_01687 [Saprolegnia parasitica CBS 223.65]KDO33808.1 hypothetical protein SPRG_01687 [Saprolegnia parasitica CBS 223.65]|eukprot:XP_012195444.1 hypothetical protein SPRG_01687 [Saprolegnia parasitica CBS 223.65]